MTGLQAGSPPLVLASQSPFRRALLEAAGLHVAVHPARVDEDAARQSVRAEGGSAEDAALLLADLKAARVARSRPDALVIGADQILACQERWFDKPGDLGQAREHLMALRGREHRLATAVVCHRGGARVWHHVASPRLRMRAVSDAFVEAYLAAEGADLLSTVGAYRIEARGALLFDVVVGEHAAVIGLPMLPLLGFLRQHGILLT